MTAGDAAIHRLAAGLELLQLEVSSSALQQLSLYLDLLQRWNSAYNLTAVRDPLAMVDRHLLDSAAILPFIKTDARKAIDVGTGAGLPGVPLAILKPELTVDLLDSNSKKTRFLFQVKTALGLDNIAARHARAEDWSPDYQYDLVVSRAFAALSDMVRSCSHLCSPGGRLLAMKGLIQATELEAIADTAMLEEIHPLVVPGLSEERHLVVLAPAGSPLAP
ncbi:MAG: 16S rRNA (guanine(527)-N(7))-methyltransferase RsmG [Pseudomonadota bacterium]